ncbi:MAG: hypothetical protein AAF846_04825 [Chloroflexota bacterium]
MKKSLFVLITLFLLASQALAQSDPTYIQVNSGTDIVINNGQSAYIVLQVNNPSSETLEGVEIACTVDVQSGAMSINTDNTQAYIFESIDISETTAIFGGADVNFIAGQSGNVQLVVTADDAEDDISKAIVTCELSVDSDNLGAVEVAITSTGVSLPHNNNSDNDANDSSATGSIISINNGAEIRVAEGESIELVIQVGNAGGDTLENVVVTCEFDALEGDLTIIEDRTDARDFVSYVVEENSVVFGQDEGISLPEGQNTTIALGVLLEADSASSSAGVGCAITSDTDIEENEPATTIVSNRDENASEDSSSETDDSDADSTGSLSINNGSEITVGEGQSAELVLQFGNTSDATLDAVSIVCTISTDDDAVTFSEERTNTYGAGDFEIDGNTLTATIDSTMPQGQNMNMAVGIQVDDASTSATVTCELLNDGNTLSNADISVNSN